MRLYGFGTRHNGIAARHNGIARRPNGWGALSKSWGVHLNGWGRCFLREHDRMGKYAVNGYPLLVKVVAAAPDCRSWPNHKIIAVGVFATRYTGMATPVNLQLFPVAC